MQSIVQVDAFTAVPFRGNPAAVCVLSDPADPDWMQLVAREMNLSETAFLHPEQGGWRLRWFTPACEVDLCGHATLASAHVLWSEGHLFPEHDALFHTRSGLLTARRAGDWIELDFPAIPVEPAALTPEQLAALRLSPVAVMRSHHSWLLELASEAEVRDYQPDPAAIRPLSKMILSARSSSPDCDFVSRFFAPGLGVDEDPVTGSAHCPLAVYWSRRLGKTEFIAHQVSARGGVLRVRLAGDRVLLAGQAVTVMRGELI